MAKPDPMKRAASGQTGKKNQRAKFGLLGHNISYSVSPTIHLTAAEELGIAVDYQLYDQSPDTMQGFLREFFENPGQGLNVTVPYKEAAADWADQADGVSANTLYLREGKILATSTDAEGFVQGLRQIQVGPENLQQVVFLGFGGAVVALAEYFLKYQQHLQLHVLRRTARSEKESRYPKIQFHSFEPEVLAELLDRESDTSQTLLIQGTNAPRLGEDLSGFINPCANFEGVLVDLLYGEVSALHEAMKKQGLRVQDGLPMLIEQARLAQKIWWGQAGSYERIREALDR